MLQKAKDALILLPLIIFGLYIRLIGILAGNFGFTFDQGRDMLAAYSITQGKITLIGPTTGLAGVYHGPLWYYILAIFSLLGHGDTKLVLSAVVFLFLIVELFLFWTIKKYYGLFSGIVFFGFVSLSPVFSSLNGQLWSPNMTILSMMIAVIALIEIAHSKKRYWFLLGLALGANIQFEAAGGVFLLISVCLALLLIRPLKAMFSDYFKGALAFLLTFIPQFLFELRHNFLMTKIIFSYFGNAQQDYIAAYGQKSVEYKTGLFFDNINQLFYPKNIVITLFLLFILFALFIKSIQKKNALSKQTKIIFLWNTSIIFILWVLVNLYKDVVWNHFLFGLSVIFLTTITLLFSVTQKIFPKTTYIFIIFLFLLLFIPHLNNSPNLQRNIIGNHSYYKNQLEIIDQIYNDSKGQPFNVVVYDPTTFSYTYDYLLIWNSTKKYGTKPVDNLIPQKLVYYIVEPDNIGGRKEKWVKERDGDGEIIWTKYYWNTKPDQNDGLFLQKRIRNI